MQEVARARPSGFSSRAVAGIARGVQEIAQNLVRSVSLCISLVEIRSVFLRDEK